MEHLSRNDLVLTLFVVFVIAFLVSILVLSELPPKSPFWAFVTAAASVALTVLGWMTSFILAIYFGAFTS